MKNFTVIGNPIQQSMGPIMHSWIFNKLGINAFYNKTLVNDYELKTVVNKLKTNELHGINVTLPYKEIIMQYIDELNPRARSIGSINCIMLSKGKTIGNNTDWYGFSKMLEREKINVSGKEVIILGAGGVARSVIFSLKQLGVNNICVLNRTVSKAQTLEDNLVSTHWLEQADQFIHDDSIIVNCTSMGMDNNSCPIPKSLISEKQILIDTIYNPIETQFLRLGRLNNALVINGLYMFIFQGIASVELWFGKSLSEKINFDELQKYLEKKI